MAASNKPAAQEQPLSEDAESAPEEELPYGPYELVDDVNSLSFGADPVVKLLPGERFSTTEVGVALFLDEHFAVRKAG